MSINADPTPYGTVYGSCEINGLTPKQAEDVGKEFRSLVRALGTINKNLLKVTEAVREIAQKAKVAGSGAANTVMNTFKGPAFSEERYSSI